MNRLLTLKLETLKEFQYKYPTSHVGGSIGLLLRGVNLLRDLTKSDLDITIDEFDFDQIDLLDYEERSDASDFDYAIKKVVDNHWYVKIDIRISPEPSFDIITFEGVNYNVSKYIDIIFWKTKYANKGVAKHLNDLEVIRTGIRTPEPIQTNDYELPF